MEVASEDTRDEARGYDTLRIWSPTEKGRCSHPTGEAKDLRAPTIAELAFLDGVADYVVRRNFLCYRLGHAL